MGRKRKNLSENRPLDEDEGDDGRLYRNGERRRVTVSVRVNKKSKSGEIASKSRKSGTIPIPYSNPTNEAASDSEYDDERDDDVRVEKLRALEKAHLPLVSGKGKGLMTAHMQIFNTCDKSRNMEDDGESDGEDLDDENIYEEQLDQLLYTTDRPYNGEHGEININRDESIRSPLHNTRDPTLSGEHGGTSIIREESIVVPEIEGTSKKKGKHIGKKKGDDSKKCPWKPLTEGVEGGPANPELLSGFHDHIAYSIWQGEDDKRVLGAEHRYPRAKTGANILEKRPDVADLIRGTCLGHLIQCMYPHINMALICAFVERWQPETNSFHMPFGEITMLLHDVSWLLRIPIEGTAIITKKSTEATDIARNKVMNLLGFGSIMETMISFHSSSFKFATIESFLISKDKSEVEPAEKVAIAYLWWVLGVTLFVDKSGNGVTSDYVAFVENLDKIDTYSWGSATLASTYRTLGLATRKDCRTMGGCLSLIQAWIYAYFPMFRPAENPTWNRDQPWACKWLPNAADHSEEGLLSYRRPLDKLTTQHVQWMPFGDPLGDSAFAISRFCGILTWRTITEPYMPRRCMRQFGFVQTIPPHIDVPHKLKRECGSNKYVCDFNVPRTYFENWSDHLAEFTNCTKTNTGQAEIDYLPWFLERTHPRVHPGDMNDQDEENRADYGVRLKKMADLLYKFHPHVRGRVKATDMFELVDKLCYQLSDFFPPDMSRGK